MPKRGSVQLLLLFFRARTLRRWTGAALGCAVLFGLLHGDGVRLKAGLAQSLRQTAWNRALAGEPAEQPWPWDSASPVVNAPVPLLGLSAAMLTEADWRPRSSNQRQRSEARYLSPVSDEQDPHLAPQDPAVGDSIAVTAADGLKRPHRVKARHIIDPGQSVNGGEPAAQDPHLDSCTPPNPFLASLLRIIGAVHVDPAASPAPSPEQKL
jgi:hypothetical protein